MYFTLFALIGAFNAAFFLYLKRTKKEAFIILIAYSSLGYSYETSNHIYQYAFVALMALLFFVFINSIDIGKCEYFICSFKHRYDPDNGICHENLGKFRSVNKALAEAKRRPKYPNSCLMKDEGYGRIFVCSLNRVYND
ncbi:hypothetical protein VCHA31O73_360015 [Vibrio chagasii]|nr:hypothetical protein VCHA31O73_360015 [Vibrio chagasii]